MCRKRDHPRKRENVKSPIAYTAMNLKWNNKKIEGCNLRISRLQEEIKENVQRPFMDNQFCINVIKYLKVNIGQYFLSIHRMSH